MSVRKGSAGTRRGRARARTRAPLLVAAVLLATWPLASRADPGVLEIDQACAVVTGCFAGDAPGFPVTISAPGSYRLTSDLFSSDPDAVGIEGTARRVTLDLGGFTVSGPVSCTGQGASVSCSPAGSGVGGIGVLFGHDAAIRNGRVRGFARYGVFTLDGARIRDVDVESNGSAGVQVERRSLVISARIHRNADHGLRAGASVLFLDSAVVGNRANGATQSSGLLARNTASRNGDDGFAVGPGTIVQANAIDDNGDDGVQADTLCLIADNTIRSNGGSGVEDLGSGSVQRNTLRSNGSFGLDTTDSAYHENTIDGNAGGSVNGGVDLGANACNGAASCP